MRFVSFFPAILLLSSALGCATVYQKVTHPDGTRVVNFQNVPPLTEFDKAAFSAASRWDQSVSGDTYRGEMVTGANAEFFKTDSQLVKVAPAVQAWALAYLQSQLGLGGVAGGHVARSKGTGDTRQGVDSEKAPAVNLSGLAPLFEGE